uniref:TLDc domain-containing protein n=1 Tax=Nelumbo nucifera TaxID=4432 RepID=A0A822YXH2_NELNU|nr:TPA_asm: hypothetical protein HUJ06_007514 [Nelumbo nucifera]
MHSLKGKVADKLSFLFAKSPSSSSHSTSDSPVVQAGPQARPGHKSSKRWYDAKPLRSLAAKWRSKSFSRKDKPLDCNGEYGPVSESKEMPKACEEDKGHASERDINGSHNYEETTISHASVDPVPNLMDSSSFITADLYEFLEACLPNIVKGCQWALLYSTSKHGISLRTLLRKSADLSGPCLLIVGDMQGAVFGGLLQCPLTPTAKRKYQGTNQTFVFTTIYGQPRLFRATGANRYFYLCLNDLLALGGGGNFALCLDEDLLHGTSGPCETFGNLCLAHSPEFELKNVEVL